MKNAWIKILGSLVLGMVLGALVLHFTMPEPKTETETEIEYRYIFRSSAELKPVELDYRLPHVPDYAYITECDTTEVHDTTYIVIPRKHMYLESDGARIWYSGVDPTIDSLIVAQKIERIVERVYPENKPHSAGLFGGVGYRQDFSCPLGVYYAYAPFKWLELNARVEYDFWQKRPAVMVGIRIPVVRF